MGKLRVPLYLTHLLVSAAMFAVALAAADGGNGAIIRSVCTLLLVLHIGAGAIFVLTHPCLPATGLWSAIAVIVCLAPLLPALAISVAAPSVWMLILTATMCGGVLFHSMTRRGTHDATLRELCAYKTTVEVRGIALSLTGAALFSLSPQHQATWSLGVLLAIAVLNWEILATRRIYAISFMDLPALRRDAGISVVVPALNEESYISALLDSIERQSRAPVEVIVVDNGSTDSTAKVVSCRECHFPVRLVTDWRHQSPGYARNVGADVAHGDIILFVDADTTLRDDCLALVAAEMCDRGLDAMGLQVAPISDKRIDGWIGRVYSNWLKRVECTNPRGVGVGLAVRRELFQVIRFDETIRLSEDFEFVKRVSRAGRYRMARKATVRVSWRRFEMDGRIRLLLRYFLMESHRQLFGEIRSNLFRYEFGIFTSNSGTRASRGHTVGRGGQQAAARSRSPMFENRA